MTTGRRLAERFAETLTAHQLIKDGLTLSELAGPALVIARVCRRLRVETSFARKAEKWRPLPPREQ
jgi:hypothetical protein